MSSKTSRKTTTTTSTSVSSVAGTSSQKEQQAGRSSSRQSSTSTAGSPLSPTRYSRQHEKEELSNLNDRLAVYIDKVRNLEIENSRLTQILRTKEETVTKEESSLRSMFETELGEVRKLLDETSSDKAKLEIDVKRLIHEKEELKINHDTLLKDNNSLKNSMALAESRLNDAQTKANQALQDRRRMADELKVLEKEADKLRKELAAKSKALEHEMLTRVNLENSCQSLNEELMFKEQVHQKQMTETRSRKQIEITEIDGRLAQQYEEKLLQSLQEIREQYEIDLENNKDELKHLYDEKIQSLTSQLLLNSSSATMAMEELKQFKMKGSSLNKRLEELEAENAVKNQRLKDLERQMEMERSHYINEVSKLDKEMTNLRESMAKQLQDYQELMDIKVALDLEIAAYRKLLEGEEERLNITPVQSPTPRQSRRSSSFGGRGAKRRRTYFEESEESTSSEQATKTSAKGDIEIVEVCPDGKFVKLHNKGSKDVSLASWVLLQKAGPDTTQFKIPRTVRITPGKTVTIWSSDSDRMNEPPDNLVMKNLKWVVAEQMLTILSNSAGEEMATSEYRKQYLSSSSRHRDTGGGHLSKRSIPLDYSTGQEGERCCVM